MHITKGQSKRSTKLDRKGRNIPVLLGTFLQIFICSRELHTTEEECAFGGQERPMQGGGMFRGFKGTFLFGVLQALSKKFTLNVLHVDGDIPCMQFLLPGREGRNVRTFLALVPAWISSTIVHGTLAYKCVPYFLGLISDFHQKILLPHQEIFISCDPSSIHPW